MEMIERKEIELQAIKTWTEEAASSYFRHAPFALCLRELNRILALQMIFKNNVIQEKTPILDVGCGDGFWWKLMPEHSQIFGVDISPQEIKAAQSRIVSQVFDISLGQPFSDIQFGTVIGNCSLEHVRMITEALKNIRKCVRSDGKLILFVPAPYWAYQGKVLSYLLKKLPRISMMISGAINGFFQHWHLYETPVWESLLHTSGWKVVQSHGIGNQRSEFLYRLFLPFSLPAFFFKKLFGFYPNRLLKFSPQVFLTPWIRLIEWALHNPVVSKNDPYAYEYMIIAEPFIE